MDRKIIMVNISQLKPHPENEKIYGTDEDTQALEKSILENGLRNHIKINENNIIISGHRRWQAYKNLVSKGHNEFCEIRCEILHFDNAEDELECLVFENDTSTQRHKTIEQETRELMVYKEVEAIRAKKRMSLGGKGGIDNATEGTPNLAYLEKGETREIIFKKYGDRYSIKSPRDVDNRIKSIEKADMLRKNGEKQKSDLIIGILNNNKTSQAYSLSNIIDQMPNDRINSIIDGNISVGNAIKETKSIKTANKLVTSEIKNSWKEQTTASELSSYIDDLTEEEKQAICDKKISAYKAITNHVTQRTPKIKDNMTEEQRAALAHKQACKEAVEEYIAQNMGLVDAQEIIVDTRADDSITLFEVAVKTFSTAVVNLMDQISNLSEEQLIKTFDIIKNTKFKLNSLDLSVTEQLSTDNNDINDVKTKEIKYTMLERVKKLKDDSEEPLTFAMITGMFKSETNNYLEALSDYIEMVDKVPDNEIGNYMLLNQLTVTEGNIYRKIMSLKEAVINFNCQ